MVPIVTTWKWNKADQLAKGPFLRVHRVNSLKVVKFIKQMALVEYPDVVSYANLPRLASKNPH